RGSLPPRPSGCAPRSARIDENNRLTGASDVASCRSLPRCRMRTLPSAFILFYMLASSGLAAGQQAAAAAPQAPVKKPARVEISPPRVQVEVGETVTFTAAGYDDDGRKVAAQPTAWFV